MYTALTQISSLWTRLAGISSKSQDHDWVAETTLKLAPDHRACFYPDKLHGGMSAFLLDHMLAECCQPALTANLNISYLRPIAPDLPLTLRVWHSRSEGRKRYLRACILIPDNTAGRLMEAVRAEALFIEPSTKARHL